MTKRVRWIVAALSFLWMAFVYASFYLVRQQRPLSGDNLSAIGSLFLDLGIACAIVAVGAGIGRRLCRWLGIPLERPGEQFLFGAGLGLGACSLLILAFGLVGWLTRLAMILLFGGLALLALPDLVALGRALLRWRAIVPGQRDRHHPRGPSWWGMRFYVAATILLALLLALSPPIDWDGLFYHLTLPQLYVREGRIEPVTDMPHQYFPGLMEMLYLAAMLLRGDVVAKLLHFSFMLLLAGLVYTLARRHVGPEYGWTSLVVYTAIPMVPVLGGWAYNDLALAFYQLAALYALANWLRKERIGWVVLSAICCGLAMGVKYTSLVCPLVILAAMIGHLLRARRAWRAWGRTLGSFVGVALLVALPWYLRNLAFTGNPVYPFAYSLFGGSGWDEWRAAWYARAGSGLGLDWRSVLVLPWTLTLGVRDVNFYDGRVGPLFLLSLPFLIAWCLGLCGRRRARPPVLGILGFFALVQYFFWVAGVIASRSLFQSRLLLPALVALCAPLAYVYEELGALDTPTLSLRRLIGLSVALVLLANLCHQFLDVVRLGPVPVLVGEESREAYLERNLGAHYAAMELVNEKVPEQGRVLFLWEPRSYYCRRSAQPDAILERWAWLMYRQRGDIGSIAGSLRAQGYTHVLFYRAGRDLVERSQLDPLKATDLAALDLFLSTYTRVQGRVGEAYTLHRLLDE